MLERDRTRDRCGNWIDYCVTVPHYGQDLKIAGFNAAGALDCQQHQEYIVGVSAVVSSRVVSPEVEAYISRTDALNRWVPEYVPGV